MGGSIRILHVDDDPDLAEMAAVFLEREDERFVVETAANASEAIRAMEPAFEDVFVRHYDVQFTFDGDGLFEAESCRRIAVTPELADRLVSDPGWGTGEFRETMLDAHDIDDAIAPVAWSECVDYSRQDDAAVVTGAAASAAGASAAGASCAGAGAAGGGC